MSYRKKMIEALGCVGGEKPFVTDDHVYAIGRLVVQWAFLEQAIKSALTKIMGTHELYGPIALNHMPTNVLIDSFQAVIGYAFSVDLPNDDAVEKIMKSIRSCLVTRNLLVHSIWQQGKKPGSIRVVGYRSRGAIKPIHAEFTVEQIHEATLKTLAAGQMINWLVAIHGYDGDEAQREAVNNNQWIEDVPESCGPEAGK